MKKLLAIAVIITAFAASEAFAQTGLSGSANVSMTVAAGGTVSATSPLLFGTQVQGASSITVSPTTGGSNAAAFTLTGATLSHQYTVTWSNTDLVKGGTNNITWSPSVAGSTANTQTSATVFTGVSGTVTADGTNGDAYLWVGGTINSIPSTAPPGSYTATVTLSLAY